MQLHAIRIDEGQDLKDAITTFALSKQLQAGVVVSAVGSLSSARLRMAGAGPGSQDVRDYEGPFEIVSLIGTVSQKGKIHLHMSISDKEGGVLGGHIKEGCIVHTTVELAILEDQAQVFSREIDPATGFEELIIKQI